MSFTVTEAMARTGLSRQRVHQLLKAFGVDARRVIDGATMDKLINRADRPKGKPGRPRKTTIEGKGE